MRADQRRGLRQAAVNALATAGAPGMRTINVLLGTFHAMAAAAAPDNPKRYNEHTLATLMKAHLNYVFTCLGEPKLTEDELRAAREPRRLQN